MGQLGRVKIEIFGVEYVIATEEDPDYVVRLSHQLDDKLRALMNENPRISITTAFALTAMGYLDDYYKAADNADNLRAQIRDYLEDSAKARIEAEEAKHEVARLSHECELLKRRLGESGQNE